MSLEPGDLVVDPSGARRARRADHNQKFRSRQHRLNRTANAAANRRALADQRLGSPIVVDRMMRPFATSGIGPAVAHEGLVAKFRQARSLAG